MYIFKSLSITYKYMAFIEAGFKPARQKSKGTLVFVNGWGCRKEYWHHQLPLNEHYSMLLFNQRGIGASELNGTHPFNYIEATAEDIATLCKQFGVTRPHLVAHSMGALVAIEYQDLYGKDSELAPSSLTLVTPILSDPFDTLPDRVLSSFTRFCLNKIAKSMEASGASKETIRLLHRIIKIFRFGTNNPFVLYGMANRSAFRDFWSCLLLEHPEAVATALHAMRLRGMTTGSLLYELKPERILAIAGGQDILVNPISVEARMEVISRNHPNAQFVYLKERGHFPHVEDPTIFNSILLDFLASSKFVVAA